MSIKDRLKEAMITSMKAKEAEKLGAIRFIQAAIKKIEIDTRKDLDDAAVMPILMNLAKQRRDSIDQFRKGGREDLAVKEETELKLIQSFLPEQMGPAELEKIVDAAIQETNAKSMRDMGNVMKAVGAKAAGRAEGSVISETVKKKLAQLQA
ncbi:MAG: GatB/YqeY domain-containing protein [Bdellovibrionota bacterium]